MPRITLSGYYGCGNTGDEAVLAGILESFGQKAGREAVDWTVLSANLEETKSRHGIHAVDRMNLFSVRRALESTDLLISGGGSLLQDTTSLRSLVYYLWIVRMALARKRPVMFYAQGIGPLRRRVARILTRAVSNKVEYITVRDQESADLLREIGVTHPTVEVTADPAFVLSPSKSMDSLPEKDRPWIGISIRPWKRRPEPIALAKMANAISMDMAARILFLPMQRPGDEELGNEISGIMKVPSGPMISGAFSPSGVLAMVCELSGLIAMRLHALIFGAIANVPMVALSYDPKVRQLMNRLGQDEYCIPLQNFDAEAIAKQLRRAVESHDAIRDDLRLRVAEMRELALVNVDRALALVK